MRLRSVMAIIAVLCVGAFVVAGVVLFASPAPQVEWSSSSADPIPERFYEVWFPTAAARSFADEALSSDPSPWTRPVLNRHEEMNSHAISCSGPNGERRYVAAGDLVPLPPPERSSSIAEMTAALKGKFEPPIRDIEFTIVDSGQPTHVKLTVIDQRRTNIYEYDVVNGKPIPRRLSRNW